MPTRATNDRIVMLSATPPRAWRDDVQRVQRFMESRRRLGAKTANRYGPCPCGSGKKLKFCCGQK